MLRRLGVLLVADYLVRPTRHLFFTGKGGVGKTTLACASAVQLADEGRRVLLVSTDPASNLDDVLGVSLGNEPTPVEPVPGLFAMNIDPEAAAHAYRERMVGPYRGTLPEAAIQSMEEQFSGSCTLEIAAFDEFSRLLGDEEATKEFDHVIFDTAPTGHTLRLLSLPSAWSGFMAANTTGTSCLGPLAGLQGQQRLYQKTVTALSDAERTTLVLVSRPEMSTLQEAARTSIELQSLQVSNQQLIVNGLFETTTNFDPIALAMQRRGQAAMDSMPVEIAQLPRTTVPLAGSGVTGIESLRNLGKRPALPAPDHAAPGFAPSYPDGLGSLIDELASGNSGVILAMGKGGVGKTTVAASVAVALALRGHQVHLSTTDPASHVASALAADELPTLTVGRIDPARETALYTADVLRTAGADLDEQGMALLEEDLRSPCTEEIAVFRAFAKAVSEGTAQFVVLDTAPTGHTILLLDAALAYHREVLRQSAGMPDSVVNLLPRLRDRDYTRVLIVTLPEATPVNEAKQLQLDLRRAEIEPYAWVINQSLSSLPVQDPTLLARQQHEWPYLEQVTQTLATRTALIPWQTDPPTGLEGMRKLLDEAKSERL